MKKFIQFFTKTQTGRAIAVGAVILAFAYGAKQYYEHTKENQRTRDARDASTMLNSMAESLEEHLAEEDDATLADLPERTDWFPSGLACGANTTFPEPTGVWSALGVEKGADTRFEFRFERDADDGFKIIARRDSDCDGIYYVVTQTAKKSMTGGFYMRSETQNANE
ncbi:MAG: hypothetical protein ACQEVA_01400 [Myxococcota bacterium]